MTKKNELAGLVTGLVAVIATACFFILGFAAHSWRFAWLVFIAVPITAITMDIVTKNKDISSSIVGLVAIFAAVAFFILGFVLGKWHPGWLVFLAIPLAATLLDISRRKDVSGSIIAITAVLATVAFFMLGTFLHIWHVAWLVYLIVPIVAITMNIIKVSGKPDAASAGQPTEQQKEE